jgi:hypothetical protein
MLEKLCVILKQETRPVYFIILINFRVLKPPGGGSTDIFGSDDTPMTPRSIRNHMKSNIFAPPEPTSRNGESF